MKTIKQIGFCFLFVSALFCHAFSQKQTAAGLNVNADLYANIIKPSVGLTFETRFTKHSGLETGLFYRTSTAHGTILYTDSTGPYVYTFKVAQRFLNIPLLYKYYSKAINVSIGPTLDFYTGWKQKKDGSGAHVDNFDMSPALKVGLLGKLSKAFALQKHFIIEPEVRFGFLRTFNEGGMGLGVSGKYKF